MKLTQLTLLAAIAATLASSAAFADDQQLRNRLDRDQAKRNEQRTTIAVHGRRGVGHSERKMDERRADARFELHSNAHGQQFGAYVPEK